MADRLTARFCIGKVQAVEPPAVARAPAGAGVHSVRHHCNMDMRQHSNRLVGTGQRGVALSARPPGAASLEMPGECSAALHNGSLRGCLTLFSRCFSAFIHNTCSLSESRRHSGLPQTHEAEWEYKLHLGLHAQTDRVQHGPAFRAPVPLGAAGLSPSMVRLSSGGCSQRVHRCLGGRGFCQ